MSTDRETLQRLGAWLEEGRTALPEYVLDAVLDELPSKPQHRPWWPVRRASDMSALGKFAIAAAAVVVVAVAALTWFGSPEPNAVGIPRPSSAPSGTPMSSSAPSGSPMTSPLPSSGTIDPGRYRWSAPGTEIRFDLPAGWVAGADGIRKVSGGTDIRLSPHLPGSPADIAGVFTDACVTDTVSAPNSKYVEVGPTTADLVQALEDQIGTDATTSPFAGGTRVALREAAGLDRSTCSEGSAGWLKVWHDQDRQGYFALEVGYAGEVYLFDHDGQRFVVTSELGNGARQADIDELRAIVESFELTATPPASAASASVTPPESAASATPSVSAAAASVAPSLIAPRRPGMTASPGGVYSWDGVIGSRTAMHKIVDGHETVLTFGIGPRCLGTTDGRPSEPVRIAGFDGVAIEPYQPAVGFGGFDGDEITRAHAFTIDDATVCAFVTWHPDTPPAQIATALGVLDTLRVQVISDGMVRLNYTLDDGWDVG